MPKKKRGSTKRVSARTRAGDDALRDELRRFDLKTFDKALAKAIRTPGKK